MELSGSITKKLQGTETPPKNSFYFRKWNFLAPLLKNFKEQKP